EVIPLTLRCVDTEAGKYHRGLGNGDFCLRPGRLHGHIGGLLEVKPLSLDIKTKAARRFKLGMLQHNRLRPAAILAAGLYAAALELVYKVLDGLLFSGGARGAALELLGRQNPDSLSEVLCADASCIG